MRWKGIRNMRFGKAVKGLLVATIVTASLYIGAFGSMAAGTCKVSADAAKIRQSASTSAEVVGSTVKGSKLDVLSSTKDGSGYTWYKVYVDGNTTGYIRADLVTDVDGDIKTESSSSSSSETTETKKSEETTQTETVTEVVTTTVEACEFTSGTTTDSVSVREGASTKSNKKATAPAGQALSITGQANGSDGKVWYQISYGDVNGFIRSDYVNTSTESEDTGEAEADTETEEPEETETEADLPVSAPNSDYELKYEPNNEGVDTWYLYDHIKGTRQSIDNINAVMQQSQAAESSDAGDASKYKKIVIIMGIVILFLVIAVSILLFKLRDSYEDWEDDEDDEAYEDEMPQRPVRKATPAPAPVVEDEPNDDDIKIVTKKGKPKKASAITKPSKALQDDRKEAWQSKNFLDIDDDMEFEFLDIDK